MRSRFSLPSFLFIAMLACGGKSVDAPVLPEPAVQLSDIVIPTLPSPYYHFAYDANGRITSASFASMLRVYEVMYDGQRISEMRNTVGAQERLQYFYDNAGRVTAVNYVDTNGQVFARLDFAYACQLLTGVERVQRVVSGFVIDKVMTLSYYPDGNLRELTEHRPAVDGEQTESTVDDLFEQYDDQINVDGFSLLHDDFFDHLVLLPGVRLQRGNPARVTRTGDGLNYVVDYTYVYDAAKRPLTKVGAVTVTSGADVGQRFETRSDFSYY
jgi:hypothetical protein